MIVAIIKYMIAGMIVFFSIFISWFFRLTVVCAAIMFVSDIMFPIPAPITCNANTRNVLMPIICAVSCWNAPNNMFDTVALPDRNDPNAPIVGDIIRKFFVVIVCVIVVSIPGMFLLLKLVSISICIVAVMNSIVKNGFINFFVVSFSIGFMCL